LTHIHYAFAKVSLNGQLVLGNPGEDIHREYPGPAVIVEGRHVNGNFGELFRLKQRHPELRTVISVGGWDGSDEFSKMASTPAGRDEFAASCVDFVRRYGFDGVDIDWEFPVSGGVREGVGDPSDRQNLTLLLKSLRSALDSFGKKTNRHYELSIAAPAGDENLKHFDLPAIHPLVNYINVMAYDLWGSWFDATAFHAPLSRSQNAPSFFSGRNVEDAVTVFLSAGVPRDKIVVGVPFYGRGVKGVPAKARGLFQPHAGAASGTWGDEMFGYRDLYENYLEKYPTYWDADAQASWLYAEQREGLMISYEDRRSVALKADYVRQHRLGGIMIWELTMDAPGEASLLRSIAERLQRP
jgi:chitinase